MCYQKRFQTLIAQPKIFFVLKNDVMKNIRQILVPTDFSAPAANALNYALHLADLVGASVKVLHVYTFIPNPTAPFVETYAPPTDDLEKIYKERMATFLGDAVKTYPTKSNISSEVVAGFAADEIIEQSQKDGCSLVVMGMTGENFILKRLFGTISQKVAHEASCLVLLIPANAKFKAIERIMYATNHESIEKGLLQEAVNIAEMLRAVVHFVNINEYVTEPSSLQDKLFEELFEDTESKIAFEFHAIHSLDIIGELNNYASLHQISLMAFATKQRGWFASLFHSSLTDEMAEHAKLPLLILHPTDK